MKLHELSPVEGSKKDSKRIGRGHGSGWGKTSIMGNEWGKNPQKNGESVPDNFHFPQETVLFHPEFWISLLLQIHSQPYKRAWLPQKKAQKLEK